MEKTVYESPEENETAAEIGLLILILPPPLSLDLFCVTTNYSPIMVLQIVEGLVQSGYLLRYPEKGVGHYRLADYKGAREQLAKTAESDRLTIAQKAVDGVCRYLPDSHKRWLTLAHIYQLSGLPPIKHFKEVVDAGNYCLERNLPMDAALYYRTALDGMEGADLGRPDQLIFIDAAIGLCISRDISLAKDIQRRFLKLALGFAEEMDDPVRRVKLQVLLAKTFIKTKQSAEAVKHLNEATQILADHAIPAEIRIQVALANSEIFFSQGYITRAIELYESLIDSNEELPDDVETLKSYLQLGWAYGVAGETARGLGLIRAVEKKAKELGARELERYATLVLVIVLTDAGRIGEAEMYIEKVFDISVEFLDHYTLWPGNGKRAYLAFCRGDYDQAFAFREMAWANAKALGTPHHRGPDNIEVMLGLEERGMIHPEWNFDQETERLLNWSDIYMKGVALRFRALKAYRARTPLEQLGRAREELQQSIALLSEAGARIELAHAQTLMARLHILEAKDNTAESLLKKAWEIFSKVNPALFPKDLKPYLDRTSKNGLWVESLLKVSNAMGAVRTKKELLSKIIRQAMHIAGAERGAIFLRQNRRLEMVASRNLEPAEMTSGAFAARMLLVEQVFSSGTECTEESTQRRAGDEGRPPTGSWTGCFPICLKAKTMGVIFIDRGPTPLKLPEAEISLLRIISNLSAVALDNMEAYEEIIDLNNDLESETRHYRKALQAAPFKTEMIGQSGPFRKMLSLIRDVAESDTTVMITGETGVGKEMVAQAIHQQSSRKKGPFIAVNLAALSSELIASELFGHEKGAFTGATQTRKGRFELSGQGTLFLDDIDAFSQDIQVKMLRVLETRTFERVGGSQTLNTRFRLLAASNRTLEDLVDQGLFRSDFYYRLNVFPIRIPSLRERPEDIPILVKHFVELFAKRFNKQIDTIPKKDMDCLADYHWPGNIRELRHVIERAVLLSRGKRLRIPPLDSTCCSQAEEDRILPYKEMETQYILKALNRCNGKVSGKGGAAELLELKPTTLYAKMRRMGVKRGGVIRNASD